ncbi:ATP-binding protein [Rhodobacter sp. CZR27]|uniref:ATP-binding protein n=1 Tax=Rhodobacter sp. CZR27 TaxID=2033869 RepID=UPI000BBF24D1|nr:ATP-binding protein [Rhodobacter sp. CZR27]
MTLRPAGLDAFLDAEFDRVAAMIALAEAVRTGSALPDETAERFQSLSAAVEAARTSGAWAGLLALAPREDLAALTRLDVDLMALALAPVARPALGPRLWSLQPQAGSCWPSLPLIEDLLMLDGGGQIALLVDRLRPTAPLSALGLIRVEGATPAQTVRPAPRLIQTMLGRDAELAPPPGATLSDRRGRWEELVLPEPTLAQLRDLTAWIARGRMLTEDWGAAPARGPLALFSGPSGTGKSFAASVIASALHARTEEPWALYTLDLGRIMSKYVGETEANMNALLSALEGRNALLQIDEADGLLGKRGEVTDARDRYANLEVSHLLARLEDHTGPVILTTNLRANVDTAFLRRFQMVVDFPAPDAAARARLWQVLLPPRAPRAADLDLSRIGEAARLSGGAIRNAATYAAVLAAERDEPLGLPHIARAVWAELNKDARQIRRTEIGFLAEHLEEPC